MANNYDNAAPFYDQLSRLVFGKALVNAQLYLLQFIPPSSTILIVGGGTGWILEELTKRHSHSLNITYVEISAKMMALSGKKNTGGNSVTFVNSAIEDVALTSTFDVIITPFLFDNFKQEKADKIFARLNNVLKNGGIWLNADFELSGKWWQPILLKTMHLFFKLLCGVEASQLPNVKKLFDQKGYQMFKNQPFFGKFICSSAYRKHL
ncbi:class I SAM-dependent methyltransferase [Mucilaginibacter auburnensis]|uniref:Methyltransferase family protein n=1 Tax=Mucilaginibacter auburnensis TaxID=1457233 RepID=A0A2H9VNC7_9SPHI|nr:class I SAM-dependent methyltransferase [Mucilaginibacter auburnensis]PJJ79837.1 methyltransferase family protein [Mucilaginibacter auburnensis]